MKLAYLWLPCWSRQVIRANESQSPLDICSSLTNRHDELRSSMEVEISFEFMLLCLLGYYSRESTTGFLMRSVLVERSRIIFERRGEGQRNGRWVNVCRISLEGPEGQLARRQLDEFPTARGPKQSVIEAEPASSDGHDPLATRTLTGTRFISLSKSKHLITYQSFIDLDQTRLESEPPNQYQSQFAQRVRNTYFSVSSY